jgi:DNA repair photolyase
MDIRSNLVALLDPWKVGHEVLPGVTFAGASTELGMRLRFELSDGVLWVDVAPVQYVPSFAARTDKLAFGYRTEGNRRQVDSQLGLNLCRRVAEQARRNEERVFRDTDEEKQNEDGSRIRRVEVKELLERVDRNSQSLYTLSPYVGCTIGCKFCYASSKVNPMRAVLGLPAVPWGSYVDARLNAPDVLKDELEQLPVLPIKFCPIVSDPYQALEKRERITRRCLQTIRNASRVWPVLLLTRSTLILEDLDLIASLPRAVVGVSLPTIDDDVRRHFEPRAASVAERLDILRQFRRAGVETMVIVQPIFDGSLEALADALAETANSVSIDILRGVMDAEREFSDPRYAPIQESSWQTTRGQQLATLLGSRDIPVWFTELPPSF